MNMRNLKIDQEPPCLPELEGYQISFLQSRWEEVDTLEKSLIDNDIKSIKKLMHQWRGVAEPYGFKTLIDFADQFDEIISNEKLLSETSIILELRNYLTLKKDFLINERK